jgi:DNA (cytosine-5)-methyltransferase 1
MRVIVLSKNEENIVFKMGELFSGPGGLGLGAKLAQVENKSKNYKIEHAWANDIDEDACRTYRENIMPNNPEMVINKPVEEINIAELPKIDALSFGFPCNDFSIVGEQKGIDGDYGPLFSYGVKVLNKHNPKWFLAENVGGLQSSNDGEAFKIILKELSESGKGYILTPHLYKFEEYGIPQKRHRIIIIGIRKDLDVEFKIPKPTHVNEYISAKEALENPPIPEDAKNHKFTRHTKKVKKFLSHIPPGENAWYEGIPEELRLNVKGARMSNIYKRLSPEEPAYTVTGSGGGGTHMYHYSEPRALTNRERARLQTFKDDFIFKGNKGSIRKQVGMAVPPMGAKIIYEAVLKTFAGIDYESIESEWWEKQDKKLQMKLLKV